MVFAPRVAMRSRLLLPLCTLTGVLMAGAVLPQAAGACSLVPTCNPPVRLFPKDDIPGNLIYFKVSVADPGALTLRASDGSVIPASIRTIGSDRVFAPEADVPAGQELELTYTTVCPAWSGASVAPSQQRFAFRTTAAAPLELPTPSLTLVDQGRTKQHPEAPNLSVGYVALSYQATCTTCSAEHLTDTQVSVNGGAGVVYEESLDLLTSCDGYQISDSCRGDRLASAGHYKVEAWSSVVGAPTAPEHAVREIDLNCRLDAHSNGGLDPSTSEKIKGANDDDLELEQGCSLASSSHDGGAAVLGVAWLGLVLLRRRRRAAS